MPVEIAYPGVYIEEVRTGTPIPGVPTSTAAFVGASVAGAVGVPTGIRSFAEFQRAFGDLAPGLTLGHAVRQFFDNGGRDAVVVRAADGTAPDLVLDSALAALETTAFNLLCVPPPREGIDLPLATRAAAAALCRRRRALFVVDPSHAWRSAAAAVAGLEGFFPQRGAESALYFPFLRGTEALASGQPRLFAPCGAIAGLMARTDRGRGVWKAPAGIEAALTGVTGPALALDDRDSALLNPLGINAIRSFPQAGTVVWGARTLARPDGDERDHKYVSVRRFAAFLEDSVSRGLQAAVFEPDAEPTWARIREAVGRFLYELFRQGAMAGRTPKEAYLVKCDADTTTAADIALGRANLVVGFAPLKPAEFVILKFGLTLAGGTP